MINYNRVATRIFKILKGHGFQIKLFSTDGMDSLDPELSRRFYVDEPNLMITIDEDAEEIIFNKSSGTELSVYESPIQQIKHTATHYMLNFTLKEFGKKVEPKDFSYQAKIAKEKGIAMESKFSVSDFQAKYDTTPTQIMTKIKKVPTATLKKIVSTPGAEQRLGTDVNTPAAIMYYGAKQELQNREKFDVNSPVVESALSKMFGSQRTSRQTLENVQIVVKHKKPVSEEVRGSRSRQIHSIFIESNGVRTQFPHVSLMGARAMARHVSMGGAQDDAVAEHIIESTGNMIKLKEFVQYARKNKLINETSQDVVSTIRENVKAIAEDLKKLTGTKTYEMTCARIAERKSELHEGDAEGGVDKFKDMFTVKRFDEKFEAVLPLVSHLVNENDMFLKKIEESSNGQVNVRPTVEGVSAIQFETVAAEMGSKVRAVSERIVANEELAKFVAKVSDKIVAEAELSVFERMVLSNVLENATLINEEDTASDLIAESIKAYNFRINSTLVSESWEVPDMFETEMSLKEMGAELMQIEETIKQYKLALVEYADGATESEKMITDIITKLEAAKRGLGIANKLKDPAEQKKHKSRVMGNMNRIRSQMKRLEKLVNKETGAKAGLGFSNKLKDPDARKKHQGRVMGNMNRIRGQLNRFKKDPTSK